MAKAIMCSVDGCTRDSKTQGKPHLCPSHYEKQRKARKAEQAARGIGKLCSVVDCGRACKAYGYCNLHYQRQRSSGTTDPSATTIARQASHGKLCAVDGCNTKHMAKGLCSKHWARMNRTGTTDPRPKAAKPEPKPRKRPEPVPLKQCGVEDCNKSVKSRNLPYCSGHQSNLARNGVPVSPNSRGGAPLERVARKLVGNFDTGCWEWTGYLNQDGYGMFRPDHRVIKDVRVHRWLFQQLTGVTLAPHIQLDHSCLGGTRHCARPGHLLTVTQAEHSINTTARTRAGADGVEYPARRQHQSMNELTFGVAHGLPTALHDVLRLGDDAGFTAFNFSA